MSRFPAGYETELLKKLSGFEEQISIYAEELEEAVMNLQDIEDIETKAY